MASQSQISANRKNAQRSTGPRTPEGKAKVALNALSHGLTAVKVVAGVEDKDLFEALRAQLNREWRPGSVLEMILVDRIAELIWQLRRVGGVEVQVLERMPKWRPPGVAPEVFPLADAMAKDFAKPNPTLMRVQLYQSRLERAMLRAVRELKALQIERQMQDEKEVEDDEFEDNAAEHRNDKTNPIPPGSEGRAEGLVLSPLPSRAVAPGRVGGGECSVPASDSADQASGGYARTPTVSRTGEGQELHQEALGALTPCGMQAGLALAAHDEHGDGQHLQKNRS